MQSLSLLRGALVTATLAGALCAQGFLPPGSPASPWVPVTGSVFPGHDEGLVDVTLPFAFPFPDGVARTDIQIFSNGLILPGGTIDPATNPTDLLFTSEDVPEMLGNPSGIYGYWDDLEDEDDVGDNLFVDTSTPNLAVITFKNSAEFLSSDAFSFQIQLQSDGTVTMAWTGAAANTDGDAIVGLSAGNGVMDPGELDLSSVSMAGALLSGDTPYESFDGFGADDFDLSAFSLVFSPDGMGGYVITGAATPPEVFASASPGRGTCETTFPGLFLIPDGAGGFITTLGGTFDANFMMGTSFALTDESETGAQMLSFSYPFVGGPTTNMIDITSNGRILEAGTGEFSDFSVTATEFISDPVGQVAALWVDLDPGDAASTGQVWLHDTGAFASVTYDGIVEWLETTPLQFQTKLFPDGSVEFLYPNVPGLAGDALAGIAPGTSGGVDPDGESDLSSGTAVSSDGLIYEEFPIGEYDLDALRTNDTAELVAVTEPAIGGPFQVDVVDSTGSATIAFYFLGFPVDLFGGSPVSLGFLGTPECEVFVDIFGITGFPFAQASGVPGTPVTIADLTTFPPALAGFSLFNLQAIVINPTLSPALFPTDEIDVVIGL